MITNALKKKTEPAAPVVTETVPVSPRSNPQRPVAGELPPAPIEMGPAPDGSFVRSVPAEYPEVSFPKPEPAPVGPSPVVSKPIRLSVYTALDLPKAGTEVSGLKVRGTIPNVNSIKSSFTKYEEIPGVREVSMDDFNSAPPKFYSKSEEARTKQLADQIGASKELNPLIVAIDEKGPYILEGGHRFDALKLLGVKSFPAIVVKDLDTAVATQAKTPNPATPKTAPAPKERAVDLLKDKIERREVARISKELGTKVTIARREPQRIRGRFTGRTEPVYIMPAEFVEAAQMMGLRAETPTGRAVPRLPVSSRD